MRTATIIAIVVVVIVLLVLLAVEAEIARAHHDRARAADPDVSDTGEDEALALDHGSRESASEQDENASLSYQRADLDLQ